MRPLTLWGKTALLFLQVPLTSLFLLPLAFAEGNPLADPVPARHPLAAGTPISPPLPVAKSSWAPSSAPFASTLCQENPNLFIELYRDACDGQSCKIVLQLKKEGVAIDQKNTDTFFPLPAGAMDKERDDQRSWFIDSVIPQGAPSNTPRPPRAQLRLTTGRIEKTKHGLLIQYSYLNPNTGRFSRNFGYFSCPGQKLRWSWYGKDTLDINPLSIGLEDVNKDGLDEIVVSNPTTIASHSQFAYSSFGADKKAVATIPTDFKAGEKWVFRYRYDDGLMYLQTSALPTTLAQAETLPSPAAAAASLPSPEVGQSADGLPIYTFGIDSVPPAERFSISIVKECQKECQLKAILKRGETTLDNKSFPNVPFPLNSKFQKDSKNSGEDSHVWSSAEAPENQIVIAPGKTNNVFDALLLGIISPQGAEKQNIGAYSYYQIQQGKLTQVWTGSDSAPGKTPSVVFLQDANKDGTDEVAILGEGMNFTVPDGPKDLSFKAGEKMVYHWDPSKSQKLVFAKKNENAGPSPASTQAEPKAPIAPTPIIEKLPKVVIARAYCQKEGLLTFEVAREPCPANQIFCDVSLSLKKGEQVLDSQMLKGLKIPSGVIRPWGVSQNLWEVGVIPELAAMKGAPQNFLLGIKAGKSTDKRESLLLETSQALASGPSQGKYAYFACTDQKLQKLWVAQDQAPLGSMSKVGLEDFDQDGVEEIILQKGSAAFAVEGRGELKMASEEKLLFKMNVEKGIMDVWKKISSKRPASVEERNPLK